MLKKVFFKIYKLVRDLNGRIKLGYSKHIWMGQFEYDAGFKPDSSFSIDIQSGHAKVTFGQGVAFRRFCSVICSDNGVLHIGKNVFFNNYCSVNCLGKITIGDDTIFGEGVKLYDHNHLYKDKNTLIREQGMKYGDIAIGKNCWIGSNTIILANVTIGNNVVVGANNLIFKSIPSDSIVKAKSEQIINAY